MSGTSTPVVVNQTVPQIGDTEYTGLITSFFQQQPNFTATVQLTTDPMLALSNFIANMILAYDLDQAIGAQLDTLGVILGRSRQIQTPITGLYFSWGTANLGYGQGLWKGPFDPTTGLTILDDPSYRILLRAKIAANSWDGTIPGTMTALLNLFIATNSQLFYQDNGDMTMTVAVAQYEPSVIAWALLTGGYVPLRPAGVAVRQYGVNSVAGTPIFGFGVHNSNISGWGTGSWMTANLY